MQEQIIRLPDDAPWKTKVSKVVLLSAKSVRRNWYYWLATAIAAVWFVNHYTVAINLSPSLPQKIFVIDIGSPVTRGDLAAFRWRGGHGYDKNMIFVKEVKGIAGDTVKRNGQDFYINGEYVSKAKKVSLKGEPIAPGPEGVIGANEYYVATPYKDSFDSRYAEVGWIKESEIVGRAYAIF